MSPRPHTLAFETSGRTTSVALARGGALLAERTAPPDLRHAAGLLPVADELLREHAARVADVGLVCVSIGPGSFTGLRVGVVAAKTLAYATGCKLVAVPTLRVLAEHVDSARDGDRAVVALDARQGNVFTATFRRAAGDWVEEEPARLDRLADVLARTPPPVTVVGDDRPARAAHVLALGERAAARGAFADPMTLVPAYVRRPEPEERRLTQAR